MVAEDRSAAAIAPTSTTTNPNKTIQRLSFMGGF
jgi:hypothetical protein